jgi:hypothetical protein
MWSMGIRGVGGEGSSFLSFFNFKIVVLVREENIMDYGFVKYSIIIVVLCIILNVEGNVCT